MGRRKNLFVFLAFVLCAVGLFGQFSADPNDVLYSDLQLWEGKGIITHLPVMRPYPPQVVSDLLRQVVKKGSRADSKKAEYYLEEIQKPFKWHLEAGHTTRTTGEDYYGDLYGQIEAGGWLGESIYVEGRVKGLVMDNTSGFVLPKGRRTEVDIFDTWADITVKERKLNLRQSQNVNFAAGESNAYFQAGIMRNSFGPFWGDGVVVSADAPHAGHYSFVWRNSWFSYSTLLLELAGTSYLWQDAAETKFPDKHLIIQSFNFYPYDWLEIGYFESIVWGGRLDLTYLLPFKELFYAQSMAGFEDNSFVGLLADVRVGKTIKLPFVLYLDDTNLNDLLKLDFATKFKVAVQAGVQWTPEDSGIFRRLTADYVIVTPYMYTHRSGLEGVPADPEERIDRLSQPNYNNYTHVGTNLGVGLDPNSDRFTLNVLLEPVRDLNVTLTGRLIRHGNASATIDKKDARNDGTILDDGYNTDGKATFHYDTRFLSQDVIETTWQAGFQAQYSLPAGPGSLLFKGGYLFEYVKNKDLVDGEEDFRNYINLGIGYRY
jgi:hypothetical protein